MERVRRSLRHLLALVLLSAGLLEPNAAGAQETKPLPVIAAREPSPAAPPVVTLGPAPAGPPREALPPPAAPASQPPVLSIGASALLSGVRIAGEIDVHAMWGLDVALRVTPWLYAGARRIGITHASRAAGDRFAIGGSPLIGLAWSIADVIELYGELGVAVQGRFGGQLDGSVGVAPFGGVGARFRLAEWISVGLEGALHVPATETFLLGNAVLPRGAVWIAGGAGLMFHVR